MIWTRLYYYIEEIRGYSDANQLPRISAPLGKIKKKKKKKKKKKGERRGGSR